MGLGLGFKMRTFGNNEISVKVSINWFVRKFFCPSNWTLSFFFKVSVGKFFDSWPTPTAGVSQTGFVFLENSDLWYTRCIRFYEFLLKKNSGLRVCLFYFVVVFFLGGWYLDFLSRVSCIKIDLFWFSIGFFIFTGFHCVVPVVALCISSHAFRLISLAVDRFWSRFVFRVFHRFWKSRWNQ